MSSSTRTGFLSGALTESSNLFEVMVRFEISVFLWVESGPPFLFDCERPVELAPFLLLGECDFLSSIYSNLPPVEDLI